MPPFLLSALEVLVGIALLFGGGELFVQGAVTLALIFGIPQLVIGLTVVSLGTSAPEFFVSLGSVLQGSDALAVSNAVGSNIFNVMVVLGSSALVLPLKVESRLVRRDVPLLLAVSAAVWGMASTGRITWQSGVALLLAVVGSALVPAKALFAIPSGSNLSIVDAPGCDISVSQTSLLRDSVTVRVRSLPFFNINFRRLKQYIHPILFK